MYTSHPRQNTIADHRQPCYTTNERGRTGSSVEKGKCVVRGAPYLDDTYFRVNWRVMNDKYLHMNWRFIEAKVSYMMRSMLTMRVRPTVYASSDQQKLICIRCTYIKN
jgi:hypothetical protein